MEFSEIAVYNDLISCITEIIAEKCINVETIYKEALSALPDQFKSDTQQEINRYGTTIPGAYGFGLEQWSAYTDKKDYYGDVGMLQYGLLSSVNGGINGVHVTGNVVKNGVDSECEYVVYSEDEVLFQLYDVFQANGITNSPETETEIDDNVISVRNMYYMIQVLIRFLDESIAILISPDTNDIQFIFIKTRAYSYEISRYDQLYVDMLSKDEQQNFFKTSISKILASCISSLTANVHCCTYDASINMK